MPLTRFGRPGLLGTVARTAVITGTASMTAGAINRAAARGRTDTATYEQQSLAPVPAAAPSEDLVSKLAELGRLRDSGVLSPEEFETAKSRLLA